MKKYTVKSKISENLVEQLLHNRGVKTEVEREVFLQPDFGSAIIIFFIWFAMVLFSGISKKHFALYMKELEFRYNHRNNDLIKLFTELW